MKTAVIALTKNGADISRKIAKGICDCTRYTFYKYADADAAAFTELKALTAEIFGKYEALVFISACGIAVRMIAPHLRSKTTDPAVVAVDEGGKFAVSLLSGHIGGANALTEKIAGIVGAVPVITTATDIGGKFSPDSFAKANRLHICELDIAKEAAAAVVNGQKIGLHSDYPCKNIPADFAENAKIGVCISADTAKNPFETTLHLAPKNIVIGVGCRKNTDIEAFDCFVKTMLEKHNLSMFRVAELCTIDIKKEEAAILRFSEVNKISLKFYSAEELMSVPGDFTGSDFVMKTTGADNVCERSAALGGNRLIVGKQAANGMTFAAAEKKININFMRKII